MKNNNPFRFSQRIKSFGYAIEGIKTFLKTQHNAWVHCVISVFVITLGFLFHVNSNEWLWLILAIIVVIITEMLNTAIEFLCDMTSSGIHPQIKKIKDVAAGAVLVSSLGAVVIGLIILIPKM